MYAKQNKTLIFLMGVVSFTPIYLNSQVISGIVTNASGTPVSNALVSNSSNVFSYTKTDANGNFTIAGTTATKLTVAALNYETKRAVSVSSTTGLRVQLNNDPVLNTAVYHINFDHLRPGATYTLSELKSDFPVTSGLGFAKSSSASLTASDNRAGVDPSQSVGGVGSSLKVRFPKNALKTSASGIDVRIPLAGTVKSNPFKSSDLYISYWIKLSDNFDLTRCGGKLPSLGGEYTDKDRWKGRIMWRKNGAIQFYPELKGGEDRFDSDADRFWGILEKDGRASCTDEYTKYLTNGTWHNIELHYKFETPGKNDGYFEGWIDGGKGYKRTSSEKFGFWRPARDPNSITINYLLLSIFLGGSDANYFQSSDVFAWLDEFKVSTKRINDFYNVITPASAPCDAPVVQLPGLDAPPSSFAEQPK